MIKHLLLILTVLTLGCTKAKETNEIRIGMELTYPPFEMTNEKGDPTGVSVDMAHELGKYLGKPVKIVNTSFSGLIPALKTGKIDLVISSMGITKMRAKSIDFSIPYASSGLSFLTRKGLKVKKAQDLNKPGIKIAVRLGTIGHTYIQENFPNVEMVVLEKENAAVMEVVQQKVDAFVYDPLSVIRQWKKNKETTSLFLAELNSTDWGVGVRKGNRELVEKVNSFIKHFRSKGGFYKLSSKYLDDETKIMTENGIALFL